MRARHLHVLLLSACVGPRDASPEPAVTFAAERAAAVSVPTVVAPPSTCAAPFIVAPPHPDTWVDQAAAAPAAELGVWPTQPMRGPFASRDEAEPGCRDVERMAAAPFAEVVHCSTGDPTQAPGPGNMARHLVLVRVGAEWWAHELARGRWPHGDVRGDSVQLAEVTQVSAADRLGDGDAELTAIAEVGPPGGAKARHAFMCGLGRSGVPACAKIPLAAGGPFHGEGALLYKLVVTCDGTLSIAGWEGGKPVKLVHGRATLGFP